MFHIAYNVAKEELLFAKFKSKTIFHKENGFSIGNCSASDVHELFSSVKIFALMI